MSSKEKTRAAPLSHRAPLQTHLLFPTQHTFALTCAGPRKTARRSARIRTKPPTAAEAYDQDGWQEPYCHAVGNLGCASALADRTRCALKSHSAHQTPSAVRVQAHRTSCTAALRTGSAGEHTQARRASHLSPRALDAFRAPLAILWSPIRDASTHHLLSGVSLHMACNVST